MSAAHLYISVWFQIKFSEVETEELRFGEQCVSKLENASHNTIILDVSIILLPSVGLPRAGQCMLNGEQTAAPPSELLQP